MSSTFPGPFHQPPQARRPPLTGRALNAQPFGAQTVAGASSGDGDTISRGGSGSGSDAQESELRPGSSSHSRSTSKASIGSVDMDIEPSLPVQFPPKPTRGAFWNASYLARRSTAVGVSASIQDTKSQYTEAPAIAKVYPQNRKSIDLSGATLHLRSVVPVEIPIHKIDTNGYRFCRLYALERHAPGG
jgi:hypothetical protein